MSTWLRRGVQMLAFGLVVIGGYALDLAPPGASSLTLVITAMLGLCALGLVSAAAKPSARARRLWFYAALAFAACGVVCGLLYKSCAEESVFVARGYGARIAGTELTPAAVQLIHDHPNLDSQEMLVLSAQGHETEIWTAGSIASVRTKLTVLYLGFVLGLAMAVFSTLECLQPSALPANRPLILFLAANPRGTSNLALAEECAAIENELAMSRDQLFDFRSKWAVGVDDVMRDLNDLQPAIVHFSGHGAQTGTLAIPDTRHLSLDAAAASPSAEVVLQDDNRAPQYVPGDALAQMIRTAAPSTRLVVLNACYSDDMADALRATIDCVVGMRGAVGDTAARKFAVGFYRALARRRPISNAVAQGVATLAAYKFPDDKLPVFRTRDGIERETFVLAELGKELA